MQLEYDAEYDFYFRRWECRKARAVVLLVHGMGAHTQRWEDLAQTFLKHDIVSYAVELKGFGHTQGRRGDVKSFAVYFRDINNLLISKIRAVHEICPIFLCGESMGGVIAAAVACRNRNIFAGLILVSPAFKGRLKFSLRQYFAIVISFLLFPVKQFRVPFSSRMCTQDIDYLRQMDADKREHRLASARLLVRFLFLQNNTVKKIKNLGMPLLCLSPEHDTVVDEQTAKEVFASVRYSDKRYIEYKDMYHALTIDVNRQKVFDDIVIWINNRLT